MITEDYVSFETAKLLKEKKFNGLCTAYYDCFTTDNFHCGYEPTDFNSIDTKIRNIVAAPTLQMAMKWLREVYNIIPVILNGGDSQNLFYYWFRIDTIIEGRLKDAIYREVEKEFPTYEQACEAAIRYCLKNLI